MLSDTHGQHESLKLPQGDLLIHAGDLTTRGTKEEVEEFFNWFAAQEHPYKICIAGNHDFFFEKATQKELEQLIPKGVTYLKDSGIRIQGISIWGSPITPWFYNWAFNRYPGIDIQKHWDLIPATTDILITHGPCYGFLDQTLSGESVGCSDLRRLIDQIKPKFHIFGHIHEGYGIVNTASTTYINASILDENDRVKNPIQVIEYPVL